jgi:eukaryotic-like serine/threonine-protein kinase
MRRAPDLQGCALDGRYELRELIGEGTFGRVYRGYDRRLAREVAIKVIKPWWADDPDWAESFEREAQMLARVGGPGIVQIYDVGQAEEGLYYVTELVDGESLQDRLRREGRLSPWEACEIAEGLCRALQHAHAEQIVHRDIKPANVLISSRGQVKVGDLGIARLAEGTTEGGTATIVGTPRYMAPEQASGLPVSPATDVYSVGIVLYEMLGGHPPFNGDSAVEIALRHVQEPVPPLPPGTPRSLERIVERALAKKPDERYHSATAMAGALAGARSRAGAQSHDRPLAGGWAQPSPHETGSAQPSPHETGSAQPPLHETGWAQTPPNETASAQPPLHETGSTRIAPRYSPRRNVNPAARRRSIATLGLAFVVLGTLAVAAIVLAAPATVRLPRLHGLTKSRAISRLTSLHLHASFVRQFDDHAKPGTVVTQTPADGTQVKEGSTVQVALSKGPAPIAVPRLSGQQSSAATAQLHRIGLNAKVRLVAAPGTPPGVVTGQDPAAGHQLHPHSTVTLLVAEAPTWRALTTFAGTDGGHSVAFRIRGSQWRVVYSMTYQGTCSFVLFCNGPSARVLGLGASSTDLSFDLTRGSGQTRVFTTGPGLYQINIQPGWDSARWSLEVEDWF